MALVPVLGSTHSPQLVFLPDKDSYQSDRAGLFFDGQAFGDQGPGMKGEGCHLFASEALGDKFLIVTDDASVLKQIQPDDFGIHGEENLAVLLAIVGEEKCTVYVPDSQLSWLKGLLKNIQVVLKAEAKSAFIAQGKLKPYVFNSQAELIPLS